MTDGRKGDNVIPVGVIIVCAVPCLGMLYVVAHFAWKYW